MTTEEIPAGSIETKAQAKRPPAPPQRPPWSPWVDAIIKDWCERWPHIFTKPVPLAIGIDVSIRAALQADGKELDEKTVRICLYCWTKQARYQHAILRGEPRRNLDDSEAGVPDDRAKQFAQHRLDELDVRRRERQKQRQEELQEGRRDAGPDPTPAPIALPEPEPKPEIVVIETTEQLRAHLRGSLLKRRS
jgi:sRNA-binding protein